MKGIALVILVLLSPILIVLAPVMIMTAIGLIYMPDNSGFK
jgi:hypothetical protein